MSAAERWRDATNILCVRLDTIGDVLMTTPAIAALKERRSGRRVTLLTSRPGAAVAPLVPVIDDAIVYEAPWMKATAPRADSQPDHAMIERLRQGAFDAAVIFTVYSQNPLASAFLCHLADIPLRLAHCHENVYGLLTDWVADPEPGEGVRHEARRQLDLVASVGATTTDPRLRLRVPLEARDRVTVLLAGMGIDRARPWLVVHPGATAPSRRYPPESFAAAARLLALEDGYQIVFTGTADERDLVENIQAAMGAPSWSLVDRLTLARMAALLEQAPLLLSNNTGPVHMAAALGTPVVDLYALTNPQHMPWLTPSRVLSHDVPCKWCYRSVCPQGHHDCLRLISPADVARAVRELAIETGASARRAALLT